jgi:hypothetical protein
MKLRDVTLVVATVVVVMLVPLAAQAQSGIGAKPCPMVGTRHPVNRALVKGAGRERRFLFAGDILLSRQVHIEMERSRRNPWQDWPPIFQQADWVVGNLEGAVGSSSECLKGLEPSLCFSIPATSLKVLRQAGFRALGMANNHSGDLGETGLNTTRQALNRAGLGALFFDTSPGFWRFGTVTVGVVAFSMVAGADSPGVEVPSPILRRKLRLARRLANLVVVYVHWGSELLEWPNANQRRAAQWLIGHGADLIVGHHPHVIQPLECLQGKPVFYSLGNHLFDQKYPASKEGALADCRIAGEKLSCGVIATQTPADSAFPRLVETSGWTSPSTIQQKAQNVCTTRLGSDFTVAGVTLRAVPGDSTEVDGKGKISLEALQDGKSRWKTRPTELLAVDAARLEWPDGPEMLVTLEQHPSSLDHEESPRPYVYEVTSRGLVARWRGTALAWPLIDAALLSGETGVLCALHRGDSYLVPDPQTLGTRVAAYRWNGFGFSGVDEPAILQRCSELWEVPAIRLHDPNRS